MNKKIIRLGIVCLLFPNISLKMKLTTLFLIIAFFRIEASTYSQNTKITLDLDAVSIMTVFNEIEAKSEFKFLGNQDVLDMERLVSIHVNKERIDKILTDLFRGTDITFKIIDRQIILKRGKPKIPLINSTDIGLKEVKDQNTITGNITDTNGTPLPGANILEKGTTNGTQADFDGNFTISIEDENSVLVISYVGFATKEVNLNGQTNLSITLEESAAGLEEVVVIGYGTVKKSDITGSVSVVTNENFNDGAISSIDQALSGNVAGVQISQTSSEPGGGVSVRIRGAASINSDNSPLYVIDGFPIDNTSSIGSAGGAGTSGNQNPKNPLNSLNPNDVKSVEVLKDASATAIYGARGANGVILITTKSGGEGKTVVNYDVYSGIQSIAKKVDVLNTNEYIKALNDISIDRGETPIFSDSDIQAIGNGTDWQEEIFRSAQIQNHNLSIGGGGSGTKYYLSANYYNQEGILKNTDMKRYILRLNLTQNISERLNIDLRLNTSLVKDNAAPIGSGTNEGGGIIYSAMMYDPTLPVYDDNGNFTQSNELLLSNPVSILEGVSNEVETNRIFGNLMLNYKISDELSTKINVGSNRTMARRDTYNSSITLSGAASGGNALITSSNDSNILLEYTLNYSKSFEKGSSLNAVVGTTYEEFVSRGYSSQISQFPSDSQSTNNLSFGNGDLDNVGSFKSKNSLISYLGRVNYNLLDQFLLTGSIRIDGSSRFGDNNKFGYFPSFAFAWKLSDYNFVPELLNVLKLRTSWGEIGNQSIGNNNSIVTYFSAGTAVFNSSAYGGSAPSRIANPDLKWETSEQFNIGLDFGMFNNRITGNADYFVKNTRDMLFALPLPPSSGFSNKLTNLGGMKNHGFELLLDLGIITSENFQWDTSMNFSAIKNEVTSLGGLDAQIRGNAPRAGNSTIVKEGLPLDSYYGYRVLGLFQTMDEVANSAQPQSQPGFPIFEDANNDGLINSDDRVVLGSPFPDFTFGIKNSFTYKNLGLDIFIQGQSGNELLNNNAIEYMYASNFRRNRFAGQIEDRWTPQNRDAKWPSATNPSSYGGDKVNSLAVEDASYVRLRTVKLNYSVPMPKNSFINAANIYITGENLVTLTNYSFLNPEANVYGNSNVRIDFNSYPVARTLILGLNFKF
ncbi:TonB-linked outer membrane protein, SusC/RagA family [Arenibacter palladensis]|uniref:TonB-linked outer membrane protein, SusC/RagA family n=1 Tax=Arenibacter palladensis TaxID=237373 RepID=A0A1M5HQ38_9FLAO|nr:TonB-dependent receptor [Arenibacter palladensis]SHG17998.1 TonB-linked outer membrane protein, SusC/RagA family [Arenibacter palladensis]